MCLVAKQIEPEGSVFQLRADGLQQGVLVFGIILYLRIITIWHMTLLGILDLRINIVIHV